MNNIAPINSQCSKSSNCSSSNGIRKFLADSKTYKGEPWPDLQPLRNVTTTLEYPQDALPPIMKKAVEEVQNFVQAPYPLIATSALATVSIAGSHLVDVKRANKLWGPSTLIMLAVALSGERKTSGEDYFIKPIHDWERQKEQELADEIKEKKAELDTWKAKRSGILARIKASAKKGESNLKNDRDLLELDGKRPIVPIPPKILHTDPSHEQLALKLANDYPVSAISTSEGGAYFGGYAMTPEKQTGAMAFKNTMWDGKPYDHI